LELETIPMAGGRVDPARGDFRRSPIWLTNVISLYQAQIEGFDFKLIAGGATNVKAKNESHAIEVLKTSPIKGAKDLEGKTVAVNTLNNIVHLMAMAWIDKNGASSGKVKFVEVPFPQMEAALVGERSTLSASTSLCDGGGGKGQTACLRILGRRAAEVSDR
jgi:NitT/TauT family transport system substrate-binding protein